MAGIEDGTESNEQFEADERKCRIDHLVLERAARVEAERQLEYTRQQNADLRKRLQECNEQTRRV